MLISAIQRSESAICMHVSPPSGTSLQPQASASHLGHHRAPCAWQQVPTFRWITNKRIQGTRNSSPCPLPRAGQCLGSHLMGDSKPLLIVSPPTLYSPWMGFRGSDTLDKNVVWMWFTLLTLGKIVEPFIGFSGGPSISHSFTHYLLSIYNVARTRSSH